MPTAADVFNNITNTDGTPANSFELLLDVIPAAGGGYQLIPDITNLNPVPSSKTRQRETYASKGIDAASKYAESMTTTVNIEIVRDNTGAWQPVLNDLFAASKALGAANRRAYRVYDALGADYAFQAVGAVSMQFDGTDWDSAKWAQITFTPYGKTTWITNPVLLGIQPAIAAATPSGAIAGSTVVLDGLGFTGTVATTGVKIGGTNATSFIVDNDKRIRFVMPAGSAGSAPIVVTNANGSSVAFPYLRGA